MWNVCHGCGLKITCMPQTVQYSGINECIMKIRHIEPNIQTSFRFFNPHLKIGSFIRSFSFFFFFAVFNKKFHLYMKSVVKTTLQFNRTYNIPFAIHSLLICKRDSYTSPFNLLCFLFEIFFAGIFNGERKKTSIWITFMIACSSLSWWYLFEIRWWFCAEAICVAYIHLCIYLFIFRLDYTIHTRLTLNFAWNKLQFENDARTVTVTLSH